MNEVCRQLALLFKEELVCWDSLLELLVQENTSIRLGDFDKLNDILNAKQAMVARMEHLTERHRQVLPKLGIVHGRENMEKRLKELNQPAEIQDLWKKIRAAGDQCKRQNQINGQAIELGMAARTQALDLLRGQKRDTCQYGANGKSESGSPSRPLARA